MPWFGPGAWYLHRTPGGPQESVIPAGPLFRNLHRVATLVRERPTGLILDLDGTISEIVSVPEASVAAPGVVSSLRNLAHALPLVAILTGRPARQALNIVGLEELVYVGNHGLERLAEGDLAVAEEVRPYVEYLDGLMELLRARFTESGLHFEAKGVSFAVHYRNTPEAEGVRVRLLDAIQGLAGEGVKLVMGKAVVNVLPPVDLTKGTALRQLVKEYGLSGVIAAGDDVTDLDSFRTAREMQAQGDFDGGFDSVAIAVVGPEAPPGLEEEADYTVRSVAEVGRFLSWLAEQDLRPGRPGLPAGS